ncbi:MAG: adenosylcobinamide kinase / adenosylcobinamide-phosphate guanylyltransferase [Clostridia bacterium]|nr:adenosylcobinamide kinase / adenosylcobinamide-phosphate guanylyltransferase [Clostridia bacterium]
MQRGRLILIVGGARSGKSSFAEELARKAAKKVIYVATARVEDREMAVRVAHHRRRRPPDWETVEEHLDLASVIAERGRSDTVILVDCLGVYLSNLLLAQTSLPADEVGFLLPPDRKAAVRERVEELARVAWESPSDVLVVTNEVGSGLVPPYPLGRLYRDLLGWINQRFASLADAVYLVVAGIPLEIKSLAGRTVVRGEEEWW